MKNGEKEGMGRQRFSSISYGWILGGWISGIFHLGTYIKFNLLVLEKKDEGK